MTDRREQLKLAQRKFRSKKTHKRVDLVMDLEVYEMAKNRSVDKNISIKEYIEFCIINENQKDLNSKQYNQMSRHELLQEIAQLKFWLQKVKELNSVLMS